MIIRSIIKQDLESCATLYAEVFASAPWCEPWTVGVALDRLLHFHESKGFIGVLAEQDGLAGFALGNAEPFHSGSIFYLREMCVGLNYQSQGLGRKVYHALENELRSSGIKSVYLTTEREIPAAQFYLNNGFEYVEGMGFYAKRVNS